MLLSLLLLPVPGQAETMKCGSRVIGTGSSKAFVLLNCGEPFLSETVSGDDERRVEQWTYLPGQGRLIRILTFRGGRLSSIETGRRQ
jgi:hypothetical protein